MAVCFENMLRNSLKSGTLLNAYFIFGNDAYLKKQYVDKIVDKCVSRDDVFNFAQFSDNCVLQDVYDFKEQFPLMSDKKCVLMCDYDFEHAQKSDFDKLVEMLKNPNETTVFILWCNNITFDTKKSDKAKKIIAATEQGGGMAVQLDHRSVADLKKMLITSAQKQNISFSSSAADYLIECCGDDLNVLHTELSKLISYVKEGIITKEIIDKLCVKSVEASVYGLSKEIFSKNLGGAIKLLDELFWLKTEPQIILHSIFSAFIDAYRVYAAALDGVSLNEAAKQFGYGNRAFVLEKISYTAKKITPKMYNLCFSEIVAAEGALKGFSANERTVIEELIVRLVYILSKGEKID